jgi:tetratricopeptide (TPR) repeat protein
VQANRKSSKFSEAKMKQKLVLALLAISVLGLCASPALAQGAFGKVSGTCKDSDGNPVVGATVRYYSKDTGQKYDMKTNKRGEYMSIGIAPAQNYRVSLIDKDGKELDHVDQVKVQTADNDPIDFDVKKQQEDALKAKGYTPEQQKEMKQMVKEHDEAVAKESSTIKTLQEKVDAANVASQAGNYDTAIATLTEASQIDGTRDLIWYKLGEAYSQSSTKQTDNDEKAKRLDTAIADYQKAIDLRIKDNNDAVAAGKKIDPAKQAEAQKNLAGFYNAMGNAYARQGNTDAAVAAYGQAAQADSANGGMYYYNLGAVLTNSNKTGDRKMAQAAADAFDKAIAADPNKADAYFWKGSNLVQMATLKGDKMIAPEGTADAFQKYLELKPDGSHAQEAKSMLEGMGATIETSYGKKKGNPVPVKK